MKLAEIAQVRPARAVDRNFSLDNLNLLKLRDAADKFGKFRVFASGG